MIITRHHSKHQLPRVTLFGMSRRCCGEPAFFLRKTSLIMVVLDINLLVFTQGDHCKLQGATGWRPGEAQVRRPTALGVLSAMVPWLEVRNLAQVNFVYSAEELWPLVPRAPNRHELRWNRLVTLILGDPVGCFRQSFRKFDCLH